MDRRGNTCRLILFLAAVCGGPAALAASSGFPAEDEFAVAAGHYEAHRWDLAAESFEAFSRQFPTHERASDALFYEAEALAQLSRFADATKILEELIRDKRAGAKHKQAMFRLGEAAYLARDLPAAKEHLQAFWQAYPDDELLAHLLVYLGDVHWMLNEPSEALSAYSACLEAFPSTPLATPCTMGLARALAAVGKPDEAHELFAGLADADDVAIARQALIELARLAISRQDFAAVKQYCERCVASGQPLEPPLQLAYAEALHALRDLGAADEQYLELTEQATDDEVRRRALYGRLRVAADNGDRERLDRLAGEFLTAYPDSPLACNVHAAVGESQLARKSHDTAIESFSAAIAAGAQGAKAAQCRAGLAVCHAARGNLAEAERQLSALSEQHAQEWDAPATTYLVAERLYADGSRAEAARLFQQVAETTSSPELAAQALAGRAWAQLRQEDFLGSAATFETLLERYPGDPRAADAGLLRAQIFEQRKEYDAALAAYRRVVDGFPNTEAAIEALYLAARLHDRLRQSSEARGLYDRLIDEHADSPRAFEAKYHVGWILRDNGNREDAIAHWQAVSDRGKTAPYWRDATYLLAEDALERGDFERARSLVPMLVEDNAAAPEEITDAKANRNSHWPREGSEIVARSLLLAAQLAIHDEDWQQARKHAARVVAECPADPLRLFAEFWVAEADYRLNKLDEAGLEFDKLKSATLGRDDAWAPFVTLRRAQILAHQEQWTDAKEAAQSLIERHAEFPLQFEAQYVLGRCHAAAGEFDAARTAYQAAMDSESGRTTETAAMAQWMIGETYMHQRDYREALRAYLGGEILYSYPAWQARSLLQAGKCHELLEEWEKAEATYRRLMEQFPESDAAPDIRARLDVVMGRIAADRE